MEFDLKDIIMIAGILGSGITVYVALVIKITRLEEKGRYQTERIKDLETLSLEQKSTINSVSISLGKIETMLEMLIGEKSKTK